MFSTTRRRMSFDTYESIQNRLGNTFVLYKERLVYVNKILVDDDNIPRAIDVGYDEYVELADPELEYQKFKLGLVNTPTGTVFVSRNPIRQYKQGLTQHGLFFESMDPSQNWSFDMLSERHRAGLAKCLTNDYPTLSLLVDANARGAFSRNFGLASGSIYHRTKPVAVLDGKIINLNNKFDYLKESLEEIVNDDDYQVRISET